MSITTEQLEEIFAKIIKEVESSNFSNLSRDEKIELASNPNTLPKTLELLASDKDSDVRLMAVTNSGYKKPKHIVLTDEEYVTLKQTLSSLNSDEISSILKKL